MARHTFSIILAILMLAVLCVPAAFAASKPAARLPFAAREAIRQAQARIAAAKSRYERRVRLIELAERQKLKAAELAAMHAGNLRQAEAVNAAIAAGVRPTESKTKPADSPVGKWIDQGHLLVLTPSHVAFATSDPPRRGKWLPITEKLFIQLYQTPTGNYIDLCSLSENGDKFTDLAAKIYQKRVVIRK